MTEVRFSVVDGRLQHFDEDWGEVSSRTATTEEILMYNMIMALTEPTVEDKSARMLLFQHGNLNTEK